MYGFQSTFYTTKRTKSDTGVKGFELQDDEPQLAIN